ncbi:MAG: DUF1700 domain-containing protein [Eubacteriales bacterium]|nr:DUF1700 domain-containing protein [Eubacteriales bacterium]
MTKAVFLRRLSSALAKCGKSDRKNHIAYYSELIDDYQEEGMTEEQAVAALGSPADIAAEILAETGNVSSMRLSTKILIGILLVLGFPLWGSLVLAGLMLVLCGFILLWCVPLLSGSFTIGALIMAAVSIPGTIVVIQQSISLGLIQLGVGTACAGGFILGAFLTVFLCKWFGKFTKWIVLKAIHLFRKEDDRV